MLNIALKVASEYHTGQVDKAGRDYINHPIAVANLVDTENEKIVALLHDIIEDTDMTIEKLKCYGFSTDIILAIKTLTKDNECDYFKYLQNVKKNKLARIVKLADLKHNSDLTRLKTVTDEDLKRAEKYRKAIEYLEK